MATTWREWIQGVDPQGGSQPENWSDSFVDSARSLERFLADQNQPWLADDFTPTAEDKKAAWEFYIQLRSRITTRPLHYLDGDEQTALTSVYKLFQYARGLSIDNNPQCQRFADLAWVLLNDLVRPFTTRWHKVFERQEGKLTEDQRHLFRGSLQPLQQDLVYYTQLFAALANAEAIKCPPPPKSSVAGPPPEDFPFTSILFSPNVDPLVADAVYQAERREISVRRGDASDGDPIDITGLALSGGGLRSATFALGALQGLSKHGMLKNFDYLSTVSGGGYAGSFVSCFLNSDLQTTPPIGLGPDQLPFARLPTQESAPLRHLRASSKNLLTGGFWRKLQIPVLALAGWLASLLVVFPPIIAFTILIALTNHSAIQRAIQGTHARGTDGERMRVALSDIYVQPYWQYGLVGGVGLLVLAGLAMLLWLQQKRRRQGMTDLPAETIRWVALLLLAWLGLVVWLLFPLAMTVHHELKRLVGGFPLPSEPVIAIISALGIPLFSRLASATSPASRLRPILRGIAFALLPFLFIGALAVLIARHWFFLPDGSDLNMGSLSMVGLATLLILVVSHFLLNINACSLHPFYRDRLARAYHLQMTDNNRVRESTPQQLSQLRQHNTRGPYHIINASLNAPAGNNEALRGRTADFFMFSNKYCGSETTGYQLTTAFEKVDPSVDLATAIAISGAAASPFMGVNSSRFNFWAALLNIRLDYWLRIPGREIRLLDGNPGPVYWLKQYINFLTDRTPYVNLSDGGHIENMAVYELLRRRCRFIVVIDGECDPGITCGSLLQAMRYAKIDFDTEIDIDLSRLKHADARSLTESGASVDPVPTGKDASPDVDFHFALGRIHYPKTARDSGDPPSGLLLYIKSSMSGNESKPLQSYRERHPDFPHQSTADLAYDEEQFEAYRALGEHIVDDAFREELVGTTAPSDISQWLRELRKRLIRS